MNISIRSIAVLLAAGYPCVAFAEFLGVHVPAAFNGEIALATYIALLTGLTMLSDYSRREYPGIARRSAKASNVSCERHRLAA